MYNFWEKAFFALAGFWFTGLILIFLMYMPYSMHVESECLKKGYPKYAVSYKYDAYCVNLDGDVVVKVDKL